MDLIKEIINWLMENGGNLILALMLVVEGLEVLVRFTPTEKDDGFVERLGQILKKLHDFVGLPNVKKK